MGYSPRGHRSQKDLEIKQQPPPVYIFRCCFVFVFTGPLRLRCRHPDVAASDPAACTSLVPTDRGTLTRPPVRLPHKPCLPPELPRGSGVSAFLFSPV